MLRPRRVDLEKLREYVLSKRGKDGGYLSYQYMDLFESSAEDTYYAVSSLQALGRETPRASDTARFLLRLQREDWDYASLPVAYYAVKALALLVMRPRDVERAVEYFSKILEHVIEEGGGNTSHVGYVAEEHFLPEGSLRSLGASGILVEAEMPTALASASLAVEGLTVLGRKPLDIRKEVIDFVLELKTPVGDFRVRGPSIESVYHAVKTLLLLGYDIGELTSTRD